LEPTYLRSRTSFLNEVKGLREFLCGWSGRSLRFFSLKLSNSDDGV